MKHVAYTLFAAATLLPFAAAAAESPGALKSELIALETQSWVAWQTHDGPFFEHFLSDDHVEMQPGGITGKASVVAGVAGPACVVASYKISDFTLTVFSATTALLTYRAEQDTTCGGAKVLSPVWATSLFVKRAGHWTNALYAHTPIH